MKWAWYFYANLLGIVSKFRSCFVEEWVFDRELTIGMQVHISNVYIEYMPQFMFKIANSSNCPTE